MRVKNYHCQFLVICHSEPFIPAHIESFIPVHTEPFIPVHTEPFIPAHSEPFIPAHTEPFIPAHSEPFIPAHSEPFIPVHSEPVEECIAAQGKLRDQRTAQKQITPEEWILRCAGILRPSVEGLRMTKKKNVILRSEATKNLKRSDEESEAKRRRI